MNGSRQAKIKFFYRIWAGVSLLAWLAASSYCSAEFFFGHLGLAAHHHHHDGDSDHDRNTATAPREHSHGSDPGAPHPDSCCKSLTAVAQTSASFQLLKVNFDQLFALTPLWLLQAQTLPQPEAVPSRQPKSREWVLTLEVSLGPAHRSHAPPFLV